MFFFVFMFSKFVLVRVTTKYNIFSYFVCNDILKVILIHGDEQIFVVYFVFFWEAYLKKISLPGS